MSAARARVSAKTGDSQVYVVATLLSTGILSACARSRAGHRLGPHRMLGDRQSAGETVSTLEGVTKKGQGGGSSRLAVADVVMQPVSSPGVESVELSIRMKL